MATQAQQAPQTVESLAELLNRKQLAEWELRQVERELRELKAELEAEGAKERRAVRRG